MKRRTYKPGETIIQKGETGRDLFFLTEGVVEISTREEDGEYILNEIESPQVLGDFAFYYGLPRTATAKAKTEVEVFVLKHKDFEDPIRELPELLTPVFRTFVSRIKARDNRIIELEEEISRLKRGSKIF